MQLAYYDESGDDGYPRYSSPFFVLSALYLSYLHWRPSHDAIVSFRRELKQNYGLPVRLELHTKHLLMNKEPYRAFCLPDDQRVNIISLYCDLIAKLDLKIINVVIVKPRIRKADYQVLDTALRYSIQRIENDLNPDPDQKFMVITDSGRVGKMRHTARRMQKINFIPSKFGPPYRREITSLIEDPLPKDSKESHFIQLADLVSFVVYLYSVQTTGIATFPARLPALVTSAQVVDWMERLKNSFNLSASSRDPYGVVYHPQ